MPKNISLELEIHSSKITDIRPLLLLEETVEPLEVKVKKFFLFIDLIERVYF